MEGPATWGKRDQGGLQAAIDELPTFLSATVLHLGHDDPSLLAMLTGEHSCVAHVSEAEVINLQMERRYDLVVIGTTLLASDDGHRRAVMHAAMQHVDRGGHLVIIHQHTQPALGDGFRADDLHLLGCYPVGTMHLSLYRRGDRLTVHDLLFEAHATIRRLTANQLHDRMQSADPPLVLDTRTHTDRGRFGVIPGSVHVPRTVVEWHLDPANGYLHPEMRSFDQALVLVCNGGYSSSLAAANLVRIGFTDVADLIGGHTAWCTTGLPVVRADHSHLDTPAFDEMSVKYER